MLLAERGDMVIRFSLVIVEVSEHLFVFFIGALYPLQLSLTQLVTFRDQILMLSILRVGFAEELEVLLLLNFLANS